MESYTCTDYGQDFWSEDDVIENLQGHHINFIKRPGRPGIMDNHGHIRYCFECEGLFKDHRNYGSGKAMLYLKQCHGDIMSSVTHN